MLAFFSLSGAFFFTSFYTQNVRGYSPLHAGLLTIPLAAGQLLLAPRTAALSRRFGAKLVVTTGLLVVALALIGYHLLGVTTSVWLLEAVFLIQGAGMGMVMPVATEGVMSVVPRDRGGAGSAITNTSRQVAVALGVAVLGSIVAQDYRTRLTPYLSVLPRAARATATQSIAQTQAVAVGLGHAGTRLLTAASVSFVHAMHLASLISVVIAVLGAMATLAWMPGRPAGSGARDGQPPAEPALAGPSADTEA
jgi:Na+/melibiose symporter-like transporter